MELDKNVTVPDWTKMPPPYPLAVFPEMELDNPPIMLSLISCTTPDEPGLMFSTRRGLQ
jgi:hypothetical protein